jgi:non-heme Fe2+,alpha-ketoglutarate-dependent halogenase
MPKPLSQQQIERYRRDGFVSPVRVLWLERAGEWRRELEAAEAPRGGAIGSLPQTKLYRRSPWACRLAATAAILDAVEDLIAPDILLHENTIWAKNADAPSFVSWHRDNTYFGFDPRAALSVSGGALVVAARARFHEISAGITPAGSDAP